VFSYFSKQHNSQKQDKPPYNQTRTVAYKNVITISITGTRTIYNDRLFSKKNFHTIFMIDLS